MPRNLTRRLLAGALIVAFQVPAAALLADDGPARLTGTILSAADRTPMVGVKLLAANPGTGEVFPSPTTDARGQFDLGGLPAGRYELAVAVDDGLYLIETPVPLAPGMAQAVNIAVDPQADPPDDGTSTYKKPKPNVWNNPFTAALIVIGSAIVVGVIVNNATNDEDEPPATPF